MQHKQNNSFLNFLLICATTIIVIALLFSCNPQRKINKAYNTVAANIPASLENKAKLGGWVAYHSPIEQKESVIEHHYTPMPYIDTNAMNDFKNDFIASIKVDSCYSKAFVDSVVLKAINATKKANVIVCPPCIQKTTNKTGKDTVGNFAKWLEFKVVSDSLTKYKSNNYILNDQLVKANLRADAAESKQHKLLLILILVAAVGFASHYLRNKLKF
jgi:hypothetical protein